MDVTTLPCPICGQTNYELGTVEHYHAQGMTSNHTYKLYFRKEGQPMRIWGVLENLRAQKPARVDKARHCLSCGHVAMFIANL